ncbi:MAG: tyrosine-type recombinase/integrase [Stellaceae bacterium]
MKHEIELPPYVTPTKNGACRYRRRVPETIRERAKALGEELPAQWFYTFRRGASGEKIKRQAERLADKHDRIIKAIETAELPSPELKALIADAERDAGAWLAGDESDRLEFVAMLKRALKDHPASEETAVMLNVMEHGGRYQTDALTLSQAHEADKAKPKRNGRMRDQKPIAAALADFKEAAGDMDLRAVKREHVEKMIAALRARGVAGATIVRRLTALRGLYTRTTKHDDVPRKNPFAGHDIADSAPSDKDRLPFDRARLKLIDDYLSASVRVKPETRDILRLMKGTGAGPAEIAGLALGDVALEDSVPHIWIRENKIRTLKTGDTRDRQLPLLGDALAAIREAVAHAKKRGKAIAATPVFKGYGMNGRGADSISAKLNKAIRRAGVTDRKLTAYSYRHTLQAAMIKAKLPEHMARYILGHTKRDSHARYGEPLLPLDDVRDALTKALDCLGEVNPRIYNEEENPA